MSTVEYPHPVLQEDGSDYSENCSFSMVLNEEKQAIDGDEIMLSVGYILKCPGLEELVEDGRAVVGMLVHSPQASFRTVALFGDESECTVRINKFDVVSKLEVQCLILAAGELNRFFLQDFNQLFFSGISFNLHKGDVLALTEKITIYLDSSELEAPLRSIFIINRKDAQKEPILADFQDDSGKIAINLNSELFQVYSDIETGYAYTTRRCLTCAIVLPVLAEAIDQIKIAGEEEYADQKWARVVIHKLEQRGVDFSGESSTKMANDLLGNVIGDALNEVKTILWGDGDTDEDLGGYD